MSQAVLLSCSLLQQALGRVALPESGWGRGKCHWGGPALNCFGIYFLQRKTKPYSHQREGFLIRTNLCMSKARFVSAILLFLQNCLCCKQHTGSISFLLPRGSPKSSTPLSVSEIMVKTGDKCCPALMLSFHTSCVCVLGMGRLTFSPDSCKSAQSCFSETVTFLGLVYFNLLPQAN